MQNVCVACAAINKMLLRSTTVHHTVPVELYIMMQYCYNIPLLQELQFWS
jgi:hypothetical protein